LAVLNIYFTFAAIKEKINDSIKYTYDFTEQYSAERYYYYSAGKGQVE
jgi:hypothetical protein